jgi:hypothetical protein
MGYYVDQQDTHFHIAADKKAGALEAIVQLMSKAHTKGGGMSNGTCHFSWVDTDAVIRAETLEEALLAWRWEAHLDNDGNIIYVSFQGEKLGDDDSLWSAIAPYVDNDSYIEMSGEDNYHWKWVFRNGEYREIEGKVVYDE